MKAITELEKKGIEHWIKYLKTEGDMHEKQGSEGMAYDYKESVKTIELLLNSVYTEKQRMIHYAENVLSTMDITTEEAIKRISKHKDQFDQIDEVEGIIVWDALEGDFTCYEFLEHINFDKKLLK
jgi:hypothetical protein